MNVMLVRENSGFLSNSITLAEFLRSGKRIDGQNIRQIESELDLHESRELIARSANTRKLGDESSSLQATSTGEAANSIVSETGVVRLRREEFEWSRGGGFDTPYAFALPVSTREALAWTRLLAMVQRGELTP
jgi:hypothetical protein